MPSRYFPNATSSLLTCTIVLVVGLLISQFYSFQPNQSIKPSNMSTIKNVVLIGAGGLVGQPAYKALTSASFNVTVLSREGSTSTHPAGAKVTTANYDSLDSLVSAFKGADAVVSTVGAPGLGAQTQFVEAAIKAGVKRFIPSEFGCDTLYETTSKLPVFAAKVQTSSLLKEKAAKGEIEYTLIHVGPFLDFGLKIGLSGLNVAEKKATLLDGGNNRISWTTLPDVGTAIAGTLLHPTETANKQIYVQTINATQKELLKSVEKALGITFATPYDEVDTVSIEKDASDKLAKGDFSGMLGFIRRAIFADGYGSDFSGKVANQLVGVKELDEAGLEKLIVQVLKQ